MSSALETAPPETQRGPGLFTRLQIGLLTALGGLVILSPGSLKYKLEYLGFGVCHQIASHSFTIAGHQCPLCARCTGIYIGAGITLLMQRFLRPRASGLPARNMWPWLALMFGSMVLDGVNSTFAAVPGAVTPYETTNTIRLITGALSGMALMFFLYPIFNQTFWRPERLTNEKSLDGPYDLIGYFVPVGVVVGIILSANGDASIGEWLYWPVVALTFFGLLSMLVMGNVLIVNAFTRRIGAILTTKQALTPVLIGLFISIGFMLLLAYGRLEITAMAGTPAIAGLPLQPGLP